MHFYSSFGSSVNSGQHLCIQCCRQKILTKMISIKDCLPKIFVLQIPCQEIVRDGPIELPLDVGQK